MRVKTKVNALNSSYNPHFGYDKGITIYHFVDDKYSAFILLLQIQIIEIPCMS